MSMFVPSFDLQTRVENLDSAIKRHTLFSMVGSINAILVGAADNIVVRLEREGYDVLELPAETLRQLVAGPETGPDEPMGLVDEMRLLSHLAEMWREDLREQFETIEASKRPEAERAGSILGTLLMMTGAQRVRSVDDNAVKVLKDLEIELTPEMVKQAQKQMQSLDQARADARNKRRGHIEWVLDYVFGEKTDGYVSDFYASLPIERREALALKYIEVLKKGLDSAVQNILFGRNTLPDSLGASDIMIIRKEIEDAREAAFPKPVPLPKQPKFQRGPKPEEQKPVDKAPAPGNDPQ